MRRKIAFGLGLAGVLTGAGAVFGQFAVDRPPTPPVSPVAPVSTSPTPPSSPPLPSGVRPAGATQPSGGYVAPVGGIGMTPGVTTAGYSAIQPVNPTERPAPPPPVDVEIRSALGANHPWALKPEHGAYFICVKSYARPSRPVPGDNGPSARELAEALATDIRDLYRVQAFLYEHVSEERKAEMAAIAAARERARIFASQLDKYRQDAQLKGMEFLAPDHQVRFKTVNYQDQIAVLVGGFKSEEDARKALDKVRTWHPPKNKNLMDGAAIQRPGKDGRLMIEEGHLNPYLTAHVVPNPTIARTADAPSEGIDPFLIRLNEDNPFNLLKAKKGWTLAVKSFSSPVEIIGKDAGGNNAMRKFGSADKGAKVLLACGEQAEQLARMLREMKTAQGQPLGLEGFVLHTRGASLVTVGQFEGPNDPALLQTKQLLSSMKLNISEDKTGYKPVANAPTLFGNLIPIPIPKVQ